MKAKVYITLKPGLLDVQGKTVKSALDALGFNGLSEVRVGKYIEIDLGKRSAEAAKQDVERMCGRLLVNPVIEVARVELEA
jgi:phosphoribosylformylglycinamidine synthase